MNINLQEIFKGLFKTKPKVIHGQNITSDEVKNILTSFTANQWISDGIFECINTQNLKDFLSFDDTNKHTYKEEKLDCDDFSYMLQGNITKWYPEGSIGIVWGNRAGDGAGHAWNFFISENKELKFIEPQNDQIFNPSSEKIWIMII